MNLALFDLDHTLIPFDSGMAWTRFLVAAGALPPGAEHDYLAHCQQYVAGTLDIHAMHRASVGPLARFPRALLAQWGREFETVVAPLIPPAMRTLVLRHQDAGDLCAIVTATSRFIAEPIARLFGVGHLVATEPATLNGAADGALSGEIAGLPCFREYKPARVAAWLASLAPGELGLGPTTLTLTLPATLATFGRSWFYSDSASDLPLLCAVSDPVAVQPDARLRAHAQAAGWPIINRPAPASARQVV